MTDVWCKNAFVNNNTPGGGDKIQTFSVTFAPTNEVPLGIKGPLFC